MGKNAEQAGEWLKFTEAPSCCLKWVGALLYWFQAGAVLAAWVFLFTKVFLRPGGDALGVDNAGFFTKAAVLILLLPAFTIAAIGKIVQLNRYILLIITIISLLSWAELFFYWFFSERQVFFFLSPSVGLKIAMLILGVCVGKLSLVSFLRGWFMLTRSIYILIDRSRRLIIYRIEPDQLVEGYLPFEKIEQISIHKRLGKEPLYQVVIRAQGGVKIYVDAYYEKAEAQVMAQRIASFCNL